MKKNKKKTSIILIILATLLLVTGLSYAYNLHNNKQEFIQASKQTSGIIDSIYNKGTTHAQQYCVYNNMKYSKGVLSCFVMSSKITSGSSQSQIIKAAEWGKWIFKGNNDIALNDSENTYTTANLYSNGKMGCFIREKRINDQHSELEVGCSGPAKAEWFPLKQD